MPRDVLYRIGEGPLTLLGNQTSPVFIPSATDPVTAWVSGAGQTASPLAEEPDIVTFTEDFERFTVGDTHTQVVGAGELDYSTFTDSVGQFRCDIVDDAVMGRAMDFRPSSNGECHAWRNDWQAHFAAENPVPAYEVLWGFRSDAANAGRYALRLRARSSDDVRFRGFGMAARLGGTHAVIQGQDSDPGSTGNFLTRTAGAIYFARMQQNGPDFRLRVWLRGTSEPTTWSAERVHTGDIVSTGPALHGRTTGGNLRVGWIHVSIGGTAQLPPWA